MLANKIFQLLFAIVAVNQTLSHNEECLELYEILMPHSNSCNLTQLVFSGSLENYRDIKKALHDDNNILSATVSQQAIPDKKGLVPVIGVVKLKTPLPLELFLKAVLEYNRLTDQAPKAVKLKFLDTSTFDASFGILKKYYSKFEALLIVNANIIEGPIRAARAKVDPMSFLGKMKQLPKALISASWTTDYRNRRGSYEFEHLKAMTLAIMYKNVTQPVAFSVRAGLAAQSVNDLLKLVGPHSRQVYLNIWTVGHDRVNKANVQELIRGAGDGKVFVDLPSKYWEKF